MSESMKQDIIAYVSEHPFCNAKEIGKAIGDEGKQHSLELFCMRKTGLILAHHRVGSSYPVYTVNPEADPRELAKPTLVYRRKRGAQKNPQLGCNQVLIIQAAMCGPVSVDDLRRAVPGNARNYLESTADRLVDTGYLVVEEADGRKIYVYTGKSNEKYLEAEA